MAIAALLRAALRSLRAHQMKKKPYVVLVGMDFSELADRALSHAFELAFRRERSEVHVLSVIPEPYLDKGRALDGYSLTAEVGVRDGVFASLRAHVQAELDAFSARSAPGTRAPEHVESHVRVGAPARRLVQLSEEIAADLIVLGTHGQRPPTPLLVGSVTEATVRLASCPVLVIPLETQIAASEAAAFTNPLRPEPCSARHQPSARPSRPMTDFPRHRLDESGAPSAINPSSTRHREGSR